MLDFNVITPPKATKKTKSKEAPAQAMVARDPFDITPYRLALKPYEDELNRMKSISDNFQVVDADTMKQAIEMASQYKKIKNAIEDARKEFGKPLLERKKAADNAAKIYTDICEEGESDLKRKINQEMTRQKLERLEAERRAQETAREMQAKLDAESKEKGLPQVEVPIPVLSQKPEPVRTAEGSASQRVDWKWELVNLDEVPREYLVMDRVAVNSAVRGGVRYIPGIRIYQEDGVQIRL